MREMLLTLILLTVIFTVSSMFVFIYKKVFTSVNAKIVCYMWLAVMIISIIPIRIGIFPIYKITNFIESTPDVNITYNSEYTNKTDFDLPEESTVNENAIKNKQSFIKNTSEWLMSKNADIILWILLFIWMSGFILSLSISYNNYRKIKKALDKNSKICTSESQLEFFNSLKNRIGVKQICGIRIINENVYVSPCVCGFLKPVIYVGNEYLNYDKEKLSIIYSHELYHIKRNDIIFKMISLITFSVHWFNPLSSYLKNIVNEDCELACDIDVLQSLGKSNAEKYMTVIIDIAEKLSTTKSHAVNGGLFLNNCSGKKYLIRRYKKMKNYKLSNTAKIISVLFITLIFALNMILISSCSVFGNDTNNKINIDDESPIIAELVRVYHGLGKDTKLTKDHFKDIETIEIKVSIYDGMMKESSYTSDNILIDFVVNGTELPLLEKIIKKARFEDFIIDYYNNVTGENYKKNDNFFIYDFYNDYISQERTDESIQEGLNNLRKINAFYLYADPNMPGLAPEERKEMIISHPDSVDNPQYIFDPYASDREIQLILSLWLNSDYINGRITDNYEIDVSGVKYMPNLSNLIFNGLKPVVDTIPQGINVTLK